jgi:hypothetical protein
MENTISKAKIPVTFSIGEDMLPQIAKWQVGKRYRLEMEVEQIALSKIDDLNDKEKKQVTARFKVLSVNAEDNDNYPEPAKIKEQIAKRLKVDN